MPRRTTRSDPRHQRALLWSIIGDTARVRPEVQAEIDARVAAGDAAVSAITFWELRHARRKRHPAVVLPPIAALRLDLLHSGLREIPLTGNILIDGIELVDSGFHDDPMDQMIVATALSLGLSLWLPPTAGYAYGPTGPADWKSCPCGSSGRQPTPCDHGRVARPARRLHQMIFSYRYEAALWIEITDSPVA